MTLFSRFSTLKWIFLPKTVFQKLRQTCQLYTPDKVLSNHVYDKHSAYLNPVFRPYDLQPVFVKFIKFFHFKSALVLCRFIIWSLHMSHPVLYLLQSSLNVFIILNDNTINHFVIFIYNQQRYF